MQISSPPLAPQASADLADAPSPSADRLRTVGSSIADLLVANGVSHVFGIPGTHNLEIYRGLDGSGIAHTTPRHEQGAAYAADGYARSSGLPGVIITTSGPGLLNAAAGLATSYADSVPVLAISPGPARGRERLDEGWLHEVKDQRAAMDALVSRSVRCGDAVQLADAIHSTFARWRVERPRPVHIEVPVDLLDEPLQTELPPPLPALALGVDAAALRSAARLLTAAARPTILAGGGASDASAELRDVAERLGAVVVTTTGGKGVLDETHPLSGGVAVPYAQDAALAEADVLLVVGSELAETDLEARRIRAAVVRVDVDASKLCVPVTPAIAVLATAASALRELAALLPSTRAVPEDARARALRIRRAVSAAGAPMYASFHAALADVLPDDVVIVGDSSQVVYRGAVVQLPQRRPRGFLYPNGFSTLGYGLPAAIGAKLATPERAVVGVLGDGALLFSVQEMATAAAHRVDITLIVIDNSGYGEIRDQMLDRSIAPLGVDLQHDLVAIAQAFGWSAARGESLPHVIDLVERAMRADGPSIVVATPDALLRS